jgi:hypothetical protein
MPPVWIEPATLDRAATETASLWNFVYFNYLTVLSAREDFILFS